MSTDLRNSIYLWAGGLAFFGLFWAALHFKLFSGVSDTWLWPVLGIMPIVNLLLFLIGLWQRRASNPDNPNRR